MNNIKIAIPNVGKRRKVLLRSLLTMTIVVLLAGCSFKPNSDYAPVVCEALRQYEHWEDFVLLVSDKSLYVSDNKTLHIW